MQYILPPLPRRRDFGHLRPCLGNTRVDNVLGDFGRHALSEKTVEQLLCDPDSIPKEIRDAVMNNGGGHANHSLFWQIMGAGKGGEPKGRISQAIRAEFGSSKLFVNASPNRP